MIKFFDMDGTLAKFYYHPQCLERMWEQGYFRNLKPYKLLDYVKECIQSGDTVLILSACIDSPFCEQEKREWLRQYLPELPEENYLFTRTGENKALAAAAWMEKHNKPLLEKMVLIDDYGANLEQWQKAALPYLMFPVKYYNGRNGTKHKNYEYSFKTIKQLRRVMYNIEHFWWDDWEK